MSILVTGGLGYIGSHAVVELLSKNENVIILDNLCNTNITVLDKIKEITGTLPKFYECDLLDKMSLEKIFIDNDIELVMHFAGLKSVAESVIKPLLYYNNNVIGTINLLDVMKKYNCNKIIFSSSATVYGISKSTPITEESELCPVNPYAKTKYMIEQIINDMYISDNEFSACILRYFNPIGAHETGIIGENPSGEPNNLLPYIVKVASGEYNKLKIYGNDYDTKDGTGVRDYIHVVDLVLGHIKAVEKIRKESGVSIYNLGAGTGYSVLEVVNAFEKANNVKVHYEIVSRRPGDIGMYYANVDKARSELGWEAKRDLEQMCKDAWNFKTKA